MTRPLILILSLLLISHLASAKVMLIGNNTSLSFDDVEANFTPMIKKSDQCGVLYVAEPLDACSDLVNTVSVEEEEGSITSPPYVLIIRGGCSFEDKIRNSQKAGFKAAIVYDNEDYGFLISMAGNPSGVVIYGTFVSKATGEILKGYAGRTDMELWLLPSFETSAWSIMAISFIALLAMSAVLATCFFVRRHRIRRRRVRSLSGGGEFTRMGIESIRRMATTVFNGVCEGASTSISCAICIEDYHIGDKLRILPCNHKFHVGCVDLWLGQRRSFCPVCKRDARTINIDMPPSPSERTPLLSPSVTPTSSFLLSASSSTSSVQSSYDIPSSSTTMQLRTGAMYLSHSRSHTSFQNGSFSGSLPISVSRSSVDLRSAASRGSYNSPRSVHSRYTHMLSPGNASTRWVVGSSSSQRGHSFSINDSQRSLSHFASASSLPDC